MSCRGYKFSRSGKSVFAIRGAVVDCSELDDKLPHLRLLLGGQIHRAESVCDFLQDGSVDRGQIALGQVRPPREYRSSRKLEPYA